MGNGISQIAQKQAGHVEDHIVNVEAAQQGQKLGQLNEQNTQ